MNKNRRKELNKIGSRIEKMAAELSDLISDLEAIRDEEEEAFENLPDSLRESEQGERMREAIEHIEQSIYEAESIDLQEITSAIDEAASV